MIKIFSPYSGLPRPVYFLFFARIVNRIGDFVRVFLTIYLTRHLGYTEAAAGIVVTMSAVASLLGSLAGGKAGDIFPRKLTMLLGQALSGILVGVCGFVPDSPAVPALLIGAQFFFGVVRPINGAMLVDHTPAERRQRAFSLLYLGINVGAAIGPLLAGVLFNNFRRWIFWGDALTTFGAMLLIYFFVPEAKKPEVSDSCLEEAEECSTFKALAKRPTLLIFYFLSIGWAIIYTQFSFALPLQTNALFGEQGPGFYGIIMSFNAVIVLVLTPVILKIFEKKEPLKNYTLGAALNALGFGLLFLNLKSIPFFMVAAFVWTIGEIIAVTNEGIFTAALTPVSHRSRFNAIRNAIKTFGSSISPALAGFMLGYIGFSTFWLIMGAVGVVQVIGLIYLQRRKAKLPTS